MASYVNQLAAGNFEASGAWLGSSEMGWRVRAFDWSTTPLGPIDCWPQSLKSAVAICLQSPFEMAIYWGPELTCIYNDAESAILGGRHPQALGRPARELSRDSWTDLEADLRAVLERGESSCVEDEPLTSDRRGRREVSYFTYSYTPIPAEDGTVGGALRITQDTTARVLAQRRLEALDTAVQTGRGRVNSAVTRAWSQARVRYEDELRATLDDLRAAQRRVAVAGDAERRRIERDLHDGAQQRLMAIRLELGTLEERLKSDPQRALSLLPDVRRELDEALQELRELAHGLYPPLLATDGLEAALNATARRSPMPVTVEATGMARAPRSVESTAYFCCLEALQNAAKHAGPGACATVELGMTSASLTFRVTDDGAGFDPHVVRPGYGLVNLRDRLGALGGTASITSSPGGGTTVSGEIPLPLM